MILCNPPCCTPGYTWCHTPGHRQGHTWGCTPGHSHAAHTLYSSCKHAGIISPPHITGPPVNTPTGQDCSTPSHRCAPSATCLSLWASWQSRHTQPVQGLAVSPERVQQESKEGAVLGVRKKQTNKKIPVSTVLPIPFTCLGCLPLCHLSKHGPTAALPSFFHYWCWMNTQTANTRGTSAAALVSLPWMPCHQDAEQAASPGPTHQKLPLGLHRGLHVKFVSETFYVLCIKQCIYTYISWFLETILKA